MAILAPYFTRSAVADAVKTCVDYTERDSGRQVPERIQRLLFRLAYETYGGQVATRELHDEFAGRMAKALRSWLG